MPRVTLTLLLALSLFLALGPVHVTGQEASPAATSGALLDVLVDRAELPVEEGFLIFGRNIVPPGARQTITNPAPEIGVIAIIVESGVLTYELDGPGRILRDAGTTAPAEEMAPTGEPFTLEAGDALIYHAAKRVEANESNEPVSFLWMAALEPVPPPPPDPSDVGEVESIVLGRHEGPWLPLPDGPISLRLHRTTVEAGASLPVVAGGMQAVAQESGAPGDLLIGGDGAAFNLGEEPVEALVMTVVPATPSEATPATSAAVTTTSGEGGDVAIEEVATVTLLAEAMPEDDASFDAWMSVFAPGEELAFPSYGPQVSIAADVVMDGDYSAQSEGRMQRQRDGQVEEITPGTEVALGPGDAVVYVENSAAQQVRNPGETETVTVSFGVFPDALVVTPTDWQQSGLAGRDVAVRVQRLTLPPGASLPPYQPSVDEPSAYLIAEGALELAVVPASDTGTPIATLQFLTGQTLPFRTLRDGNQFVLRNAGSEPLTLIRLTLGPAEPIAPGIGTPAG